MIDNYKFFRDLESVVTDAAYRIAVAGIENGHIYILGTMTLVVTYMGVTIAAGGMSLDRLKGFILQIAAVIFLLSMNFWMGSIAPAITTDMPSIIMASSPGVGGGDIYQQAAAMESQIDAITAKVETAAGYYLAIYAIPIYVADLVCRILVGCIFAIMFFFKICLHVVVTYAAWMLLLLLFKSTQSYFMAAIGTVVSIFCAMIGCQIVYTATLITIDSMSSELIATIDGMQIGKAISAFLSFGGKIFVCVILLFATGLIAARIGGGFVVAGAAGGLAIMTNKITNVAHNIQQAAQDIARTMKKGIGNGRN